MRIHKLAPDCEFKTGSLWWDRSRMSRACTIYLLWRPTPSGIAWEGLGTFLLITDEGLEVSTTLLSPDASQSGTVIRTQHTLECLWSLNIGWWGIRDCNLFWVLFLEGWCGSQALAQPLIIWLIWKLCHAGSPYYENPPCSAHQVLPPYLGTIIARISIPWLCKGFHPVTRIRFYSKLIISEIFASTMSKLPQHRQVNTLRSLNSIIFAFVKVRDVTWLFSQCLCGDLLLMVTVKRLMKQTANGFIQYGRHQNDWIETTRFVL